MKKIYNIVLASTLLLSTASCEDWLTMPSDSKLDSSTVFSDYTRAEMVLLGCYPQTFNAELIYQFGMGTDECISSEGASNSKNQVGNYVYTSANSPSSTYKAMYKAIEYSNIVIKNIPNVAYKTDIEKKKLDMLSGEALAIRSMCFLNLTRYFGDIPHPMQPVEDLGTFISSRVSRDAILDDCISDLQNAVDLLPWQSEQAGLGVTGRERISKNTAYGLLARTALYAAGYSLRWNLDSYDAGTVKMERRSDDARIKELYKIAADACEKVITQNENSLNASFEQVFRDLCTGQFNNETMFEFGQQGTDVNGLRNGYTNGIYCHADCIYKKTQPAQVACPTFYFDYEEGDTRRDVTVCNYSISSKNAYHMNTYAGHTNGKFRAPWTAEFTTGKVDKRSINFPLLRYSDVLLMYAEALNEYNNGPTPAATSALKQVRTRAYGNDESKIGVLPTSYQDFRKAIIEERKLELAFEGLRRTDLIRWNILTDKLKETKEKVMHLARRENEYAEVPYYRVYQETKATEFKAKLVSIPYIAVNEKLSEADSLSYVNKGYTVLPMLVKDKNGLMHNNSFTDDDGKLATWITNLYRGLLGETETIEIVGRDQVELLPLNTTIINDNPGLVGQQHPKY